jgi:hypothetical protein
MDAMPKWWRKFWRNPTTKPLRFDANRRDSG